MRSFHWSHFGCKSLLRVVRKRLLNDEHDVLSIVRQMLIYTTRAEISISGAVTALVPPPDNVLAVTQRARDAFVKCLPWLRNADLLQRIQGKDQY